MAHGSQTCVTNEPLHGTNEPSSNQQIKKKVKFYKFYALTIGLKFKVIFTKNKQLEIKYAIILSRIRKFK